LDLLDALQKMIGIWAAERAHVNSFQVREALERPAQGVEVAVPMGIFRLCNFNLAVFGPGSAAILVRDIGV